MSWELNDDRNFPVGYVLTDIEKSLLLEGEASTYSRADQKDIPERISNKITELPVRFQDLIDDLVLFSIYFEKIKDTQKKFDQERDTEEFLRDHNLHELLKYDSIVNNIKNNHAVRVEEEDKEEVMPAQLLDYDEFAKISKYDDLEKALKNGKLFRPNNNHPYKHSLIADLFDVEPRAAQELGTQSKITPPGVTIDLATKFGIELGCALRLFLQSYNSGNKYEDILYGFILAEVATSPNNSNILKKELENLLEKYRERATIRTKVNERKYKTSRMIEDIIKKSQKDAELALLEHNIKPTDSKISVLTSIPNPDISDIVLKNKELLKSFTSLEDIIRSDSEYISSKNLSGVQAAELFDSLFYLFCAEFVDEGLNNMRENISRGGKSTFDRSESLPHYPVDVVEFQSEFDIIQQHVTRGLGMLSKRYDYTNTGNPKYKITKETEKGWKLTGYGKVLGIYRYEDKLEFLYEYALEEAEVRSELKNHAMEDALSEILTVEMAEIDEVREAQEKIQLKSLDEIIKETGVSPEELFDDTRL